MPWPCFIGEKYDQRTGAMWQIPTSAGAPDWWVRLPNGAMFNVDGKNLDGVPWTVTGKAPNLTVMPSIDYHGTKRREGWHGGLVDGVLSDDILGRRYG